MDQKMLGRMHSSYVEQKVNSREFLIVTKSLIFMLIMSVMLILIMSVPNNLEK